MTTSFYSTKRNKNVNISNDKVCGYRIKNPWMPKGFSDGVKSGLDNGVVDQKLSRFATEEEREKSSSNCAGNRNWLNHKVGDGFRTPESADTQFNVNRPKFLSGTEFQDKGADEINNINIRNGVGNRLIERPNFMSPEIMGRFIGTFDKLQAVSLSEAGPPTGLLEDGLGYETVIKIPDPTDFKWLAERLRIAGRPATSTTPATGLFLTFEGFPIEEIKVLIEREIEINPPFGRPQRTISKKSDNVINDRDFKFASSLRDIGRLVNQGRAESKVGQRGITNQLIKILGDTVSLSNMSKAQSTLLSNTFARLKPKINKDFLNLDPIFVDILYYRKNIGKINFLILSKVKGNEVRGQYDYNKPVLAYDNDEKTGLPAVKFSSLTTNDLPSSKGPNQKFLDLNEVGRINYKQLINVASNTTDGFKSSIFSLESITNADGNVVIPTQWKHLLGNPKVAGSV